MTVIEYPWNWLTGALGESFVVRCPWADELRRAARQAESACVLVPLAAGSLDGWADWLAAEINRDGPAVACLAVRGAFGDATRGLADLYGIGEPFRGGRPADWARRFLADARREMPQCDPVPVLVVDADDACAAGMQELVAAQRALGYSFARPVLVRRTLPPGWSGEVTRFGIPELVGDLYRISPPPARDITFWTNLVLALTVTWEAGATPPWADELWEQLQLTRTQTLRDAGFDDWLQHQLQEFADKRPLPAKPLPERLVFGPVPEVDDEFWQRGVVVNQGGRFDVLPLRARVWVRQLPREDQREALRRRRLANVPLARWLSAWAASIEESLRVAALVPGSDKFRRFLKARPPRTKDGPDGAVQSRWDELDAGAGESVVDAADFGDLVEFLSAPGNVTGTHPNLARMLGSCRQARNRVVHERRIAADDILKIAAVVEWLSESGFM